MSGFPDNLQLAIGPFNDFLDFSEGNMVIRLARRRKINPDDFTSAGRNRTPLFVRYPPKRGCPAFVFF